MKTHWLAVLLASASLLAVADGGVQGVLKPADPWAKSVGAPRMKASAADAVRLQLPAMTAARTKSLEGALAPNQIGVSRRDDVEAVPRIDAASLRWNAAADGFAAHMRIAAPHALGLRVGLRFDALPRDLEIRVAQVAADGSLEVVGVTTGANLVKLARGVMPIEHWTASTDGVEQVIELWSPRAPDAKSLRFTLTDVSHLLQRTTELYRTKLDFACHVDIACIAGADIANDSKAVARMRFTRGGSSFFCTGALLNDRASSLTPLFATANHCISTQAVAASLETWFFYRDTVCNSFVPQTATRLNEGAFLLVADRDSDFALLRLNSVMPGTAFFLGWDPAGLVAGQEVFGIHHPNGDFQRYSSGVFQGLTRVTDSATDITFADFFNRVRYTQGIVEGGSSGSPLLTAPGTFRGTLFGSPDTNTCGGTVLASYSSFNTTYPLIKTFLDGPNVADEYGDSSADAGALEPNTKLVATVNSDGDADWLRFTVTAGGQWTVASFDPAEGAGIDVKAEMYAADGSTVLMSSDDVSDTDLNFSMVRTMTPGTYYLRVTGVNGATGNYGLRSSFVLPDDFANSSAGATEMPINGTRTGLLGVLNDQDWFRLTFTEAGVFRAVSVGGPTDTMGAIYQADGATLIAENDDANFPDTNFGVSATIAGPGVRYLKVSGFDGQTGPYTVQTSFTAGAATTNYTDIWWNPAESGWGINLNHQSDTIFSSLFTYAADGKGLWLVGTMTKQANGMYTGPLYRTVGPAFNASPWTATTPTQVGTMTFTPGVGNAALVYSVNGTSVTKTIQRQVFAGASATCSATTGARTSATNYQDLWWNANESGWGINFAHQGSTIFATLYTYGADNRDMWLTATITRQSDGSFFGSLYRTTGPVFNAAPWTSIGVETVGDLRATFTNGTAGTLTYTFNGVTVTKAIERQVFAAAPSVCQ